MDGNEEDRRVGRLHAEGARKKIINKCGRVKGGTNQGFSHADWTCMLEEGEKQAHNSVLMCLLSRYSRDVGDRVCGKMQKTGGCPTAKGD